MAPNSESPHLQVVLQASAPRREPRLLAHLLSLLLLLVAVAGLAPPTAVAAEILSARSATLLQIGDQNRSYGVRLACIAVDEVNGQDALSWMQRHGPRGTKVNLRPIGAEDGILLARVSILRTGLDLGDGLIADGLASRVPCPTDQP